VAAVPNSAAVDCDFCLIARGEDESAEVVCAAADWVAFLPPTPATLGHTLVIPRSHVPDFLALDPEAGASLMNGIVRVGLAIRKALSPDGMNLISSSGKAAQQTVFHLHFHLVPRWIGDRIGNIWPPDRPIDEEVKEDLADLIRSACSSS
jgi:histidine triad (HIT) family protein